MSARRSEASRVGALLQVDELAAAVVEGGVGEAEAGAEAFV